VFKHLERKSESLQMINQHLEEIIGRFRGYNPDEKKVAIATPCGIYEWLDQIESQIARTENMVNVLLRFTGDAPPMPPLKE
jgi:hypothetical protein